MNNTNRKYIWMAAVEGRGGGGINRDQKHSLHQIIIQPPHLAAVLHKHFTYKL